MDFAHKRQNEFNREAGVERAFVVLIGASEPGVDRVNLRLHLLRRLADQVRMEPAFDLR
jgi:hypothetical protein